MRLNFRLLLFYSLSLWLYARLHAQTITVPTLSIPLPDTVTKVGATPYTLELTSYFSLPTVTGPVVQFNTILGKYNAELYTSVAPINANNFLSYVNAGSYTNSFIDRSVPGFVVQGGSFDIVSGSIATIPTQAPVVLEYKLPNAYGTLAAARTSVLNSATSAWYINTVDNSTTLDTSNGGGYTVFGRILGTGMSVVNAIAALPVYSVNGGQFPNLPVYNYNSSSSLTLANLVIVNSITQIPVFPTTNTTTSVVSWSINSSNPSIASAFITGSTLSVTPTALGSTVITITASDTNGNTTQGSFNYLVSSNTPTISTQPTSQTVTSGSTVVFSIAVTLPTGVTYQWYKNGILIPNATSSTLMIQPATVANSGSYTCNATNAIGTVSSAAAELKILSTTNPGRLVNLSVLTLDGPDDQMLTLGFVNGSINNTGIQSLLIRAAGPALSAFQVQNVLNDPTLTLYQGSSSIVFNDNWGSTPANIVAINNAEAQTGAFALTSITSLDAAIVQALPPGSYTVQVAGNGTGVGKALAEVYDNSPIYIPTSPRLINLSCRQQVVANGTLTAGFVINGATSKTVLIRASGPALSTYGVQNVMPDPQLNVFSGSMVIASNSGWMGDPSLTSVMNTVGAFPYTNKKSKDSAVLITLAPGSYTAQATSATGTAGTTLIEVYEVP